MHRQIDSAAIRRQPAVAVRREPSATGLQSGDDFRDTLLNATESVATSRSGEESSTSDDAASRRTPAIASATVTHRSGALAAIAASASRSRAATQVCVDEQRQRSTHSLATQQAESSLATSNRSITPQSTPELEQAPAPQAHADAAEARDQAPHLESQRASAGETSSSSLGASASRPVSEPAAASETQHAENSHAEQPHAGETPSPERVRAVAGSTTSITPTSPVPAATTATSTSAVRAASRESIPASSMTLATRGVAPKQSPSPAPATKFSMPRPAAEEPTMMLRTGKALAAALKGEGDLKLNLSPEELGRLQVRMACDQEGMSIQLTCERPESAASLESGKESLRRSLESQGVRVKQIEVRMAGDEGGLSAAASHAPNLGVGDEHSAPREGGEQARRDIPAHAMGVARARDGGDDEAESLVEVPVSIGTALASVGAEGVSGAIDTVV